MNLINNYIENVIKYDYITKFNISNTSSLPKLLRIVLSFDCNIFSISHLISCAFAMELITNQRSKLTTKTLPNNINLKLKSGVITGCSITLRKHNMLKFLANFILVKLPQGKQNKFLIVNNSKQKTVSFLFKDLYLFNFIEDNYSFFKSLPSLKVLFITNTLSIESFIFILASLKVPVIKEMVKL